MIKAFGSASDINFDSFDNISPLVNYSIIPNHATAFNIEELLASLENTTGINVDNFTEDFLKASLWPSLQPHNWHEQAEKILQQPEYIVMLILCVFALITNIMSIMAVCHVQHSLTMHLKLIINLAISDIFIVISVLVHMANKIFNNPGQIGITERNSRILNACFLAIVSSFNIMSFLITLLNLLAMAVDHFIAIMHPFRYPYIMSKRHGYILIAVLWSVAAIGGLSNFMSDFKEYRQQTLFNYCEFVMYDSYHGEYLISGVTLFCMFSIIFIYTRIFFEVRKLQAKMPSIPNLPLHTSKAMITTLVIIGTFILCWLPNCMFQITMIIEIHVNRKVIYKLLNTFILLSKYLYILQLTNCLLDPIIYAVRLKVVKQGYKNFLEHIKARYKSWFHGSLTYNRRNRRRRQTQYVSTEWVAMKSSNNLELDLNNKIHESQNLSATCKSEESDINDNELVPMVTVHASANDDAFNTEESVDEDTTDVQECETSFIGDECETTVQCNHQDV